MKSYPNKSQRFFEFIKLKDTSMWEIFSQMIDGKKKKSSLDRRKNTFQLHSSQI